MDKRRLHHAWKKFRRVRPWYFLVLALLSLMVCVYGLRANNIEMARLRAAVYQADRENGDVQGTLTDLQQYVTSHMNAGLSGNANAVYPPIQLKYTYERLVEQAARASNNEQVYIDAQAYCEQANPDGFSGRYRVECIKQYVASNGAKVQVVPDSLYKFDFVAPLWSPGLAGWSAVATVGFLLIATSFWLTERWLKSQLRNHI